jgi:hypothetical protein
MITWALPVLVAAGLLGSAWVHYVVWGGWACDTAVVGPLFQAPTEVWGVVTEAVGILLGIALMVVVRPVKRA